MRRSSSPPRPTLIQTFVGLIKSDEPAFANINPDKLREAGDEYYARESKRLGEFLVSRATITPSQLDMALGIQAEMAGEHDKAVAHFTKALDELRKHTVGAMDRMNTIIASVGTVFGDD